MGEGRAVALGVGKGDAESGRVLIGAEVEVPAATSPKPVAGLVAVEVAVADRLYGVDEVTELVSGEYGAMALLVSGEVAATVMGLPVVDVKGAVGVDVA